jgi:hypothetical protein
MSKIIAIARLSLAGAAHSRVILSLTLLLLGVLIGLPLIIKGDGTAAGYLYVLLNYTLGFSSFLLGLAAVWSGCAAVSLEVQDRHAHLLVTKPVHPLQIWLGKGLGLAILYGGLFVLCGALAYIQTRRATRNEPDDLRRSLLAARQVIAPDEAELVKVIREARDRAAGIEPPEGLARPEAERRLEQTLRRQFYTVPAGVERTWRFNVPAGIDVTRDLQLQFHFTCSQVGPHPVPAVWRVTAADRPEPFEVRQTDVAGQTGSITIPAGALTAPVLIQVSFTPIDAPDLTVLFRPDGGLLLRGHAGSFEGNLLRALLLLYLRVMFLAALGLTAGALFSTPVAAFATFVAMVVLHLDTYVHKMARAPVIFVQHTHDAHPHAPGLWDAFFRTAFKTMDLVLRPLHDSGVLDPLSSGTLISWATVGHSFLIKLVLYGGLLALLAAGLLRRRELGLPDE